MEIAPALFIERCEPNAQLLRFLETTNSCDTQVVRKGRILNAGCAKVLCSEESLAGVVAGWPALQISMRDVSELSPYLDSREQQRIIEDFQPKLEMFRLKNFVLALSACPNVSDVSPAARELALCLKACVAGDVSQSSQLTHLLKLHRPHVHTQTEIDLHSIVIKALLWSSHLEENDRITVAEVTAAANRILERCGELLELKPRTVGNILRTLGFSTQRLGAPGRGIMLMTVVRRRIHKLAKDYRILVDDECSEECPQCQEVLRNGPDERHPEQELVDKLARLTSEQLEDPFGLDSENP
jgi:hypothetical protein